LQLSTKYLSILEMICFKPLRIIYCANKESLDSKFSRFLLPGDNSKILIFFKNISNSIQPESSN